MSKHLLIVCKACGLAESAEPSDEPSDGVRLLEQLQQLHQTWPRRNELALETTSCLCICDHPCAVALVGTQKPSYLFGDLPPLESAADLLTACELYLDSDDGMVPAFRLPAALRPRRIARIPAAP